MLIRELLNEHGDWASDKSLETDLAKVLTAVSTAHDPKTLVLSDKGSKLLSNMVQVAKDLGANKSDVTVYGKPSGARPTYGSGSEPKSDLNVSIGGKVYALSVKAGPAYAVSAGAKHEFLGIAAASIELFQEMYPNEAEKHRQRIVDSLVPIAEVIGISKKISDYTPKALADKKDSWFKRGFEKPAAKSVTDQEKSDIEVIRNQAETIIDTDNESRKGEYKSMLLEMESIAKNGIAEAFKNEEFARCFIWEISSGVKKFNGVSEINSYANPNAAYANTIVYLNGKGVFDLSSQKSEYVSLSLSSHSVRLQNVPRGWIMTYFKRVRQGSEKGAQTLADALREIEFSLKIGVGPGAKGKIKESLLMEFAQDKTLNKNLVRAIKSASLLQLADAFGAAPILELR